MTELLETLNQPHLQMLLRLVVGGLLLLAGITKLAGRESFRQAVDDYEILPRAAARPFAAALPLVEIALGTLLLLGLGITFAAALAVAVFLSFSVAIGVNLARGRDLDCHCFGSVQSEQVSWTTFLRSFALMLAALTVATATSRFGSLELALFGSSESMPSVLEMIPVVILAAVIFDVLILLPEALAFRAGFNQLSRTRITGAAHTNGHSHQPHDARSTT